MSDYTFFSKDPGCWGKSYQSLWGHHNICPLLQWFHIAQVTQSELTSLTHLKVWGDTERFYSDVAFLLVLSKEGVVGERVYGLTMVWVHLYQARVSTIGSAVEQLTQLASTGPNWPYALVQLNGDAHHVPLPKEGHLSVMVEESTSHVPYRRIHQLEVCQLLSSGSWVVYLEGLNGCQVLVIMTLPKSLSNGMTMFKDKATFLQVDFSQSATKEQESETLSLGGGLSPTPATTPTRAFPPKVEGQISMTMEVTELLSQAVLDTSGLTSRSSTPKTGSLALATLLPLKPEDFTKLVDTSLKWVLQRTQRWMIPHWRRSMPLHPLGWNSRVQWGSSLHGCGPTPGGGQQGPGLLVGDQVFPWCAMEEASLWLWDGPPSEWVGDHWGHQGSEGPLCLHYLRCGDLPDNINKWSKVWHTACIKEIEDDCNHALAEAENCCSTATREADSSGASKACSIQQSHIKDIQCLEAEAIEEEGKDCLAFLTTCGTALRASPPEACGIKVTPFHLLLGNDPMSTLLSIPPGISPPEEGTCPTDSSFLLSQQWQDPHPQSKLWHYSPDQPGPQSPSGATSKATPEEPSHSKWKEEMPFHKALSWSCQEAFSRDSRLVWNAREDYYQENHLHFNSENSCNVTDIFQNRIKSTGLLCSEIHEIQETWMGWCELKYTNYTLKTLPKGLNFFQPVFPLESQKVMGLTNIHHPDALCHFNGVTHCSWCR